MLNEQLSSFSAGNNCDKRVAIDSGGNSQTCTTGEEITFCEESRYRNRIGNTDVKKFFCLGVAFYRNSLFHQNLRFS